MVTTQSATTVGHSPQPWNHIPIEGDHRNMVKFFHKLDPNYVKVKARLKSLVAEAAAAVEKRFSPIAGSFTLFAPRQMLGPSGVPLLDLIVYLHRNQKASEIALSS